MPYDEKLVRKGMKGERIIKNQLMDSWMGNNTDDIKKYCVAHGPDIWKNDLLGCEVKYWSQRYFGMSSLNNEVVPRLKGFGIKVLFFLYEGSLRPDDYSERIKKMCRSKGIIAVPIDIETSSFKEIEDLEKRLSKILPRYFQKVIVNSNNEGVNYNDGGLISVIQSIRGMMGWGPLVFITVLLYGVVAQVWPPPPDNPISGLIRYLSSYGNERGEKNG